MRGLRACPGLVVTLALLAPLVGPVGSVHASAASLRAVIKSSDPTITFDEGRVLTSFGTFESTGNPAPVRLAIAAEIKDLNALKFAIAAQRASSPRTKKGKSEFIAGIRSIVSAYRKLSKAFGETTVKPQAAKTEAQKAAVIVKKGRRQLKAAIKLLS
jgi:hypothetical protein